MYFQIDYKPSEPFTLVTDLMLAVEGLLFAVQILILMRKNKQQDPIFIFWIGMFLCAGLFALSGAISHSSNSTTISELLWPMTVIMGGFAVFFFSGAIIIFYEGKLVLKQLLVPTVLLMIYVISLVVFDWNFIIFVGYQLISGIMIIIFCKKISDPAKKQLADDITIGLMIILLGGIVQAIGGIVGYRFYFGSNQEYLVQIHNDIFHVMDIVGLYQVFQGLKKSMESIKYKNNNDYSIRSQ